jgi:hypothetical protein
LNLKVVDVFSFHLRIFHCAIARIFSGSQSMKESNPFTTAYLPQVQKFLMFVQFDKISKEIL